jgi:hypothetical protein
MTKLRISEAGNRKDVAAARFLWGVSNASFFPQSGIRNPKSPPCSCSVILHSDAASRLRVFHYRRGWVAQLVEQWTENPRVGGSIPPPATFLSATIQAVIAVITVSSETGR